MLSSPQGQVQQVQQVQPVQLVPPSQQPHKKLDSFVKEERHKVKLHALILPGGDTDGGGGDRNCSPKQKWWWRRLSMFAFAGQDDDADRFAHQADSSGKKWASGGTAGTGNQSAASRSSHSRTPEPEISPPHHTREQADRQAALPAEAPAADIEARRRKWHNNQNKTKIRFRHKHSHHHNINLQTRRAATSNYEPAICHAW